METSDHNDKSSAEEPAQKSKSSSPAELMVWWAMLVIAVIAIPTGGAAIAMVLPLGGLAQLVAFVIGCWICTWVGMWLMEHSKKFDKK